ncbi:MAG: peptidoglycan DD-metalloendopeptidase family protein, partial [Bacteroidetes bacterium]|nr:peptidoglycan DD-metalloendopeptidase family protein [Bacteroidota bacterium]
SHVLNDLKSRESELKKQLSEKQMAAEKIARAIQKIIEEEAKKAAELAKKNRTPGEYALTPEDKLISDNFGNNKGRLPWPTERGEITSTFGEHEHPVLHGIKVRNNGVDISTQKGAIARAVFEGEVRQVLEIPGADKVVIIRHGSYLSVYQNLDNVFVSTGDKIKAKQSLGTIHTKGSDNTTTLQFQIWQESTKLDPALWLSR